MDMVRLRLINITKHILHVVYVPVNMIWILITNLIQFEFFLVDISFIKVCVG